jgi:hypothetical protein
MQRLEVSGAIRPLKWPLGVKWLRDLIRNCPLRLNNFNESINTQEHFCRIIKRSPVNIYWREHKFQIKSFVENEIHVSCMRLFFEVLPFRKSRVVPRHLGAPVRLIIWSHLNPILLKLLRHRTELERAQTANNFRRNSFACGNLSFLTAHFGVVQWSLCAQGSCPASPPLCPAPNRCNAMGTILNSQNN